MYIDLHIELSSLIEFYNEEKSAGREVLFTPKQIFDAAKTAVLNSEKSPFYVASDKEDHYFKKYKEYAEIFNEGEVPDFFQHENNIYDLESILYVKSDIGFDYFSKLFILKILQTHENEADRINDFFQFQLYDNFFGDIAHYITFIKKLPDVAPNWEQLGEIGDEWIIKAKKKYKIKSEKIHWIDFLSSKKNYKIPGKLSDKQIKFFFTFLIDKIKGEESYLKKEDLDIIFQNGFTIPSEPLENKFKLNLNRRRVKKAVDKGIHVLYNENTLTNKDKNDYILFLAHYIKDYSSALLSYHELEKLASNIKGKSSSFWKISWDIYLPKP